MDFKLLPWMKITFRREKRCVSKSPSILVKVWVRQVCLYFRVLLKVSRGIVFRLIILVFSLNLSREPRRMVLKVSSREHFKESLV